MTPVKKTKAEETVKVTATKEKASVKAAAPKQEEKKSVKKTAAPVKQEAAVTSEPKATVTIEYAGGSIQARSILDRALEAFKAGHSEEVKTIDLYIQPEQGVAYYVVNGEGSEEYKVSL